MDVSTAVKRARELVARDNLPMIVYRRHGRVAVITLRAYLDADLDGKGAKRIYVATRNAKGEII